MTKFEAGQRWTYRTRASEPQSTLVIGAVETDSSQRGVVHIAVDEVASPSSPEPIRIGHMPFSEEAISSSVVTLAGDGVQIHDDFNAGVEEWRRAKGGVFAIAVSEAIDAVVGAVSSRRQEG